MLGAVCSRLGWFHLLLIVYAQGSPGKHDCHRSPRESTMATVSEWLVQGVALSGEEIETYSRRLTRILRHGNSRRGIIKGAKSVAQCCFYLRVSEGQLRTVVQSSHGRRDGLSRFYTFRTGVLVKINVRFAQPSFVRRTAQDANMFRNDLQQAVSADYALPVAKKMPKKKM